MQKDLWIVDCRFSIVDCFVCFRSFDFGAASSIDENQIANRQSAIKNRPCSLVMILDLRDGRKRYLNYLASRG
jgi:hypothetical protein